MSSIQDHHIKGYTYPYRHTYVDGKVVCTRHPDGGETDGRRTTGTATRLSNSPYNHSSYHSQDDLDRQVCAAYAQGYGTKRIQTIFADELDLHPTRREVENYLKDMGIELRKREPKPKPAEQSIDAVKIELAQAKENIAIRTIEQDSADVQTKEMRSEIADNVREILRLKEKLMDYRDMGRPPTDDEIEELIQ